MLTDGESDDPHLFSKTRTISFANILLRFDYKWSLVRDKRLGSRISFGASRAPRRCGFGDRNRRSQFRLEPDGPLSVGSQNAELVSISFAHLVS